MEIQIAEPTQTHTTHLSIAVVDDDPSVCHDVYHLFSQFREVTVEVFQSIQDFKSVCKSFDIFILDLRLAPKSDDLFIDILIDHISSRTSQPNVIVLSNHVPYNLPKKYKGIISAYILKGKFYKDRDILLKEVLRMLQRSAKNEEKLASKYAPVIKRLEQSVYVEVFRVEGYVISVNYPYVKVKLHSSSPVLEKQTEVLMDYDLFASKGLLARGQPFAYIMEKRSDSLRSEAVPLSNEEFTRTDEEVGSRLAELERKASARLSKLF